MYTMQSYFLFWFAVVTSARTCEGRRAPEKKEFVTLPGVTLGDEMEKVFKSLQHSVYHIEVDMLDPTRLLFSEGSAIKILDGTNVSTVVGTNPLGYVEGQGQEAKFWTITGFLSINKNFLLVADIGNDCLRLVTRDTYQTSPFAGKCQTAGFQDGIAEARFNGPFSIIADATPGRVFVSDRDNSAVRLVDLSTKLVTTLIQDGLNYPTGMTLDLSKQNLLISNYFHISQYNLQDKKITLELAGSTNKQGYIDGSFADSRFDNAREILPLTEDILLVADQYNHAIRAVNLDTGNVSSLPFNRTLGLYNPYSLVLSGDAVYVGQANGIYKLSGCPADMFRVVDSGRQRAVVRLPVSGGDDPIRVNASLSIGKHQFQFEWNETVCDFTVTIVGSSQTRSPERMLRVTAEYNTQCGYLDDSGTFNLLRSVAQQRYNDLEEICDGVCQRPLNMSGVLIHCTKNTTTVSWLARITTTNSGETRPDDKVITVLQGGLKARAVLDLVVLTRTPPVVYPNANDDGLMANVSIEKVCADGYTYQSSTQLCVKVS